MNETAARPGRARNHIKDTRSERIFYGINYLVLSLFLLCTLYPVVYLFSSSISHPNEVAAGRVVLFPIGFSLRGYELVFRNSNIQTGFLNSALYTLGGTVLNVLVTLITAYPLSKKDLIGRSGVSLMFAFTLWFSGGMIPSYLLVRSLGMLNTRWAMIIPGLISVWNVIICRSYFSNTLPDELFEAASIDGCDHFRFFALVALPLSGAIIAVLTLYYAIDHWNAFFNALIYLNRSSLYPLQIFLRNILIESSVTAEDITSGAMEVESSLGIIELFKSALIFTSCLPLWIIYPFVQKFFVKGVMIGSVKG